MNTNLTLFSDKDLLDACWLFSFGFSYYKFLTTCQGCFIIVFYDGLKLANSHAMTLCVPRKSVSQTSTN